MTKENYYDVLGITKDANQVEIKQAYRNKAKAYHPDINPSLDAQNKMKQINVAYDTLSDPIKKEQYDFSLSNPHININPNYGSGFNQEYQFNEAVFEAMMRQFYQQRSTPPNRTYKRKSFLNQFFKIVLTMYMIQFVLSAFQFLLLQ